MRNTHRRAVKIENFGWAVTDPGTVWTHLHELSRHTDSQPTFLTQCCLSHCPPLEWGGACKGSGIQCEVNPKKIDKGWLTSVRATLAACVEGVDSPASTRTCQVTHTQWRLCLMSTHFNRCSFKILKMKMGCWSVLKTIAFQVVEVKEEVWSSYSHLQHMCRMAGRERAVLFP